MPSQSFLASDLVAKDTLMMLVNNMVMAGRVERRYEANFGPSVNGNSQFTLRKPVRFVETNGAALQLQDINEPSVVITVDQQAQRSWSYTSVDRALTISEWRERYGKPAAESLANQIDKSLCNLVKDIPTAVGTPGVTPSTFASSVQLTGQALFDQGVPQNERLSLVLNGAGRWSMAGAQSNSYVTRVSEKALVNGYLSEIGNQEIYGDQNIGVQPAATYTGTPLANNATAQTGASIITNGWSTGVLPKGTIVTFGDVVPGDGSGVYAVNPQSRVSTGKLAQFVITEDQTEGGGNLTLKISPPVIVSGPYQNVTVGVPDNAIIGFVTSPTTGVSCVNNVAFAKQAFGLVTVPMPIPGNNGEAGFAQYKGIGLRFIFNWYDVTTDRFINRYDVLYGVTTYYPELAVRLLG